MGCTDSKQLKDSEVINGLTIENPNESRGESKIYVHPLNSNGRNEGKLKLCPQVKTLQGAYLHSFKKWANKDCIGSREIMPDGSRGEYKWKNYAEIK